MNIKQNFTYPLYNIIKIFNISVLFFIVIILLYICSNYIKISEVVAISIAKSNIDINNKKSNCSTDLNNTNARSNVTYTSTMLPPSTLLVYNGNNYSGGLLDSKFREGLTFSQLIIPLEKVKSNLPLKNNIILKKDSCIGFIIKNTPSGIPLPNIGITAYDNNGKAIKVLSTIENSTSDFFNIHLEKGRYILLAVATWLPAKEKITGYTIYNYLINIIDNR